MFFAAVDEALVFEAILFVVERAVAAFACEQFVVRAAFDDFAGFEDEDLVGGADR